MLAIMFLASKARAQQSNKPAELPTVEVTTSPAAKAGKKKTGNSAVVPLASKAEVEPLQADPATALGTYNPALDLPDLDLPPGTTLTPAGPIYGYKALSAMSSTKTATPIEQIPQSIQVVPKKVIEDQNNLTVSETVQNVSNVQGPNSRSLADTQLYPYTIRGFGAQAWLDGMVMPYSLGDRDAFANVERIEVLKGPAAILYGGGAGAPIGGAVNIVSKLPTNEASGEFGVTLGSHSFVQPYFDVNQPLSANGTVLFRVTGEYTATDSFIDVLEQDRYSFNPTLTLTNKTDTTLTIKGRLSKSQQQTYQGLPATGTITGDFGLDRELFIGPSDIPRSYSEVKGITVTLDHKLNDIVSANVKARWSKGSFQQNTQIATSSDVSGATPEPGLGASTWLLANGVLAQEIEEFSVNPNLQARFSLNNSRHTVLIGGDYSRVSDRGEFVFDYLNNGCAAFFTFFGCGFTGPTADLTNPTFTTPWKDPRNVAQYQDFSGLDQVVTFSDNKNEFTTSGVYGQLQSTFFDRVHVLGGLRAARIEMRQTETAAFGPPGVTTVEETKLLPRVGILVDLFPGLSPYASYSEGMRAVPKQFPGGKLLPEFSEQKEVGVKFDLGQQFSGTLSYFDIDRDNVAVNLGLGNVALASQKSRGYEADVLWQPTQNFQVLASYGYTNAEFADSLLGGIPAGNKFPLVPEHSGRVWVNYAFDQPMLKGWSVGAGIYAASSSFIDSKNIYEVEGYYTVDAKVGYENESFTAALHVKNLTGNDYLVPYSFLGGQVAPGDDRSYYGTVVVRY